MDRQEGQPALVAGGGVALLEGALVIHALAEDRVDVELLAPDPHFWYAPGDKMARRDVFRPDNESETTPRPHQHPIRRLIQQGQRLI